MPYEHFKSLVIGFTIGAYARTATEQTGVALFEELQSMTVCHDFHIYITGIVFASGIRVPS